MPKEVEVIVRPEHAAPVLDCRDLTSDCMVARALREAFPGKEIAVGTWTAAIGRKDIRLPAEVSGRIGDWLAGKPIETPFSFKISY